METFDTYVAGKGSLNKALRLLHSKKTDRKRKAKEQKDEDKPNNYCTINFTSKKKKYVAMSYSSHFAILEMRLCLARHDWMNLQRLFPLLLSITVNKEPIIWRYALIIMLYSPTSSIAHFEQFLTRCIGTCDMKLMTFFEELFKLENRNK